MCMICMMNRPFDDDCLYQEFDSSQVNLAAGETWAEWIEAPSFAHTFNDRGFMTVNSTFDGAIGHFGDSDWIRIDLEQGHTYKIQLYSYSMETHLALADQHGNFLDNTNGFQTTVVNGTTFAFSELNITATRNGTYYLVAEEWGHNGWGAYTLGVEEVSGPAPQVETWTADQIAQQLTDDGWAFFNGARRSWDEDTITYNIDGLAPWMQQYVEHAYDAWEKLTNLTFVQTSRRADVTWDDTDAFAAYANNTFKANGQIKDAIINMGAQFDPGTTFDSYFFQTLIHEIGHTLGLAHAGNYNAGNGGPPTYPDSVLYTNDSWNMSIMSYINQEMNTQDEADLAYVMTPMLADIIAIQDLYGKPTEAYAGNTRYGFNSNTGDYMDIIFADITKGTGSSMMQGGQALSFTLYDTDGVDTIDFRTDTTEQKINLNAEAKSDIYGIKGSMVIGRDTIIENVVAGSNDDEVIGNSADNEIKGNNGKDHILGMGGQDDLLGGNHNDRLEGGAGDDILNGQRGRDTLTGDQGRDAFVFEKNGGKDRITDFQNNIDTIYIDDRLWRGDKNVNEVLNEFGDETNGNVVLEFSNREVLTIVDTTLQQLSDDIAFV